MISMVSLTELQPAALTLTTQLMGLAIEPSSVDKARQRAIAILQFFEDTIAGADSKLFGNRPYFTGNTFTIADIVAGTLVPSASMFCILLEPYPRLNAWIDSPFGEATPTIIPAREFSTNCTNSRAGSGDITHH
jgi:glutathione S-transferase